MAHTLVEAPAAGLGIVVPDNIDPRDAASVEVPFQAIANRLAFAESHGPLRALAQHVHSPFDATANGPTLISNSVWTDITSAITPAMAAEVFDWCLVFCTFSAYRDNTSASDSGFRILASGATVPDEVVSGTEQRVNLPNDGTNTGKKGICLIGLYHVPANDSALQFRLQAIGGASSGQLIVNANDAISVLTFKRPTG